MNSMDLVRFALRDGSGPGSRDRDDPARIQGRPLLRRETVQSAILRARQFLLNEQRPSGSWLGRRHSDVTSASQFVLLSLHLDRGDTMAMDQTCHSIVGAALKGGGWSCYPDGAVDVSVSVQAYLALKLAGYDVTTPVLREARRAIREAGGADCVNMPTRFLLALFGQIDYEACQPILPERLRTASMRTAGQASGGTQTWPRLLLPLSIVWTHRPVKGLEQRPSIRELFVADPSCWPDGEQVGWRRTMRRQQQRTLQWLERKGWNFRRQRALCAAEDALARHIGSRISDDIGFCEAFWLTVAAHTLGHGPESEILQPCWRRIEQLVGGGNGSKTQLPRPNATPLNDTSAAICSLAKSGAGAESTAVGSAVNWVVDCLERRHGGTNPPASADSSQELVDLSGAVSALAVACRPAPGIAIGLPPGIQVASVRPSRNRGLTEGKDGFASRASEVAAQLLDWIWQVQAPEGGWPATLRAGESSAADVTGILLQALGAWGYRVTHPGVKRAVDWLRRVQQGDGSWDSRTGVRYLHGTSMVVCGMIAVGIPSGDETVGAGVNWILAQQLQKGGWSEIAEPVGIDQGRKEMLSPTQTAWAILALVAAGQHEHAAVARGIRFLLETQEEDGTWTERQFAFRSDRDGYWFRDDLHSICNPLTALSRWAVAMGRTWEQPAKVKLRLVGAMTNDE